MEDPNLKRWNEKYCNEKVIDLSIISNKNKEILRRLNIKIEDKLYTRKEFELLEIDLGYYYKEDEEEYNKLSNEEKEIIKKAEEKMEQANVSRKDLNEIFAIFDEISKKYI